MTLSNGVWTKRIHKYALWLLIWKLFWCFYELFIYPTYWHVINKSPNHQAGFIPFNLSVETFSAIWAFSFLISAFGAFLLLKQFRRLASCFLFLGGSMIVLHHVYLNKFGLYSLCLGYWEIVALILMLWKEKVTTPQGVDPEAPVNAGEKRNPQGP